MKLHELHARSLSSALGLADSSVQRMERLLTEGGQPGVVRPVEDTLSAEKRRELLEAVETLKRQVNEAAARFDLEKHPLDIHRVLQGEISSLWVIFEDCRPDRMKGYGQIFDPDVKAALEDTVNELTSQTLKIRALME